MPAPKSTKVTPLGIRKRIAAAYHARCNNIKIRILDVPKVYAVGRAAVMEGVDDETLAQRVHDYVQTIRLK